MPAQPKPTTLLNDTVRRLRVTVDAAGHYAATCPKWTPAQRRQAAKNFAAYEASLTDRRKADSMIRYALGMAAAFAS